MTTERFIVIQPIGETDAPHLRKLIDAIYWGSFETRADAEMVASMRVGAHITRRTYSGQPPGESPEFDSPVPV